MTTSQKKNQEKIDDFSSRLAIVSWTWSPSCLSTGRFDLNYLAEWLVWLSQMIVVHGSRVARRGCCEAGNKFKFLVFMWNIIVGIPSSYVFFLKHGANADAQTHAHLPLWIHAHNTTLMSTSKRLSRQILEYRERGFEGTFNLFSVWWSVDKRIQSIVDLALCQGNLEPSTIIQYRKYDAWSMVQRRFLWSYYCG